MDNIAKTVMDGLNKIAYFDDKQVKYQTSIAHNLNETVKINSGPIDVLKPLRDYDEYVFVRVRES